MTDTPSPLLRVRAADVARRVLVVGDPERASQCAALLDDAQLIGENREYRSFTGHRNGKRITITSHGIGSAGAGIAFEELARAGAQAFVRAGTCGAVRDDLPDGGLVVAIGAVREEGLTPKLVPLSYPAVADPRVVLALQRTAAAAGVAVTTGLVLTDDRFYPSDAMPYDWAVWKTSHVAAVEMEASALFIIASLHGLMAGGIFTIDGNPTRAAQDMSEYDPHRSEVQTGKAAMLRVALDALASLELA